MLLWSALSWPASLWLLAQPKGFGDIIAAVRHSGDGPRMPISDDEERELRIDLMRADLANKDADTQYKRGLLRFEPWKIALTGMAAGGALVAALVTLLRAFGGH
jgi:hypothetical protein